MEETEYMIWIVLMCLVIVLGWVNVNTILGIYAMCVRVIMFIFYLFRMMFIWITKIKHSKRSK